MDKRQSNGRFAAGNAGGPGRPKREREAEYLETLLAAVPLARWKKVASQALADAEAGDPKAREWLSKYLLPAPGESAEQTAIQYDLEFMPIDEKIDEQIEQHMAHFDSLKAALKVFSPEHPLLK